jgi:hypothetical protein
MGDQRIDADALVVALGAELIPNAVPGFQERPSMFMIHWDSACRTGMNEFQGGRLVIGILARRINVRLRRLKWRC